MEEVKSIFASRSVWGGLIAVAASLASLWGYEINSADQEAIISIIGALGGAVAVYGRIKATKRIKKG
jgi:hypothetical protein